MAADECRNIPVSLLHDPWVIMRPVVKDSIEYLERRDSMARLGPLNSLLVRPSVRQPGMFEVVDGLWRLEVGRELHLDELPCIIKVGLSDEDALAIQIHANAVRKDTTPTEYSKQLRRLMQSGMTFADLARIAGKHPSWVKDRLNLLEMSDDIQKMVDRGEMPVMSAYMLAKIPSRWREQYAIQACVMKQAQFCALAAAVIKQFTECVQQGKMDERFLPAFTPQPYLRTLKEFKAELANPTGALLIVSEGCKTLLDVWNLSLRWALHLDTASVETQKSNAQLKAQSRFKKESEASHETLDQT